MSRSYLKLRYFLYTTTIILPKIVFADWSGSVIETYPLGEQLSKEQACKNAIEKTKLKAMSNAGLESLTFEQIESCAASENKTECHLFQETINKYEGGYISHFNILSKDYPDFEEEGLSCRIKAGVEVSNYREKHDPNFLLQAELTSGFTLRDGEDVTIQIKINQDAYLYLIGWYPNLDGDNYFRILGSLKPLKASEEVRYFTGTNSHELKAALPEDFEGDESHEFLMVLASKSPMAFFDSENSTSFHQRLDDLGRGQWRMVQLAYRIVK
jgi:hypothetical protein